MLTIEEPKHYRIALSHLGFRPFFLLGGLWGAIAIALWFWLYHLADAPATPLPIITWHAHEMIYGYTLAIAAGFLLTAVRNWTGVQTLHGAPLLLLAGLWLIARLAALLGQATLPWMAAADLAFSIWLSLALLIPIVKVKQWSQLGVWSKVILLTLSNLLFYLGLFGVLDDGVRWGLYSGLYLLLSLVLLMARRVMPFFIERGVGYPVTPTNRRWLDIASLVLMLLFWLVEVFLSLPGLATLLATGLFLLHALRLYDWHTPGIWRKPLLWVLYLAYGWLVLGFGLRVLAHFGWVNPMLAVHAFAYGGFGMMTVGMMARVTLGHTARNVLEPPRTLTPIFLLLLAGSLVRVLLPWLYPGPYAWWMGTAQILWILAFAAFTAVYAPMLIKPRVDGRYG